MPCDQQSMHACTPLHSSGLKRHVTYSRSHTELHQQLHLPTLLCALNVGSTLQVCAMHAVQRLGLHALWQSRPKHSMASPYLALHSGRGLLPVLGQHSHTTQCSTTTNKPSGHHLLAAAMEGNMAKFTLPANNLRAGTLQQPLRSLIGYHQQ